MILTETMIVREICDWLEVTGYFFWRQNNIPVQGRAQPKYTPKGIADIIVVKSGMLYAIEVKRGGSSDVREKNGRALRSGKLTPHQAEWGSSLVMHGGKYACVRSLSEAVEFLGS